MGGTGGEKDGWKFDVEEVREQTWRGGKGGGSSQSSRWNLAQTEGSSEIEKSGQHMPLVFPARVQTRSSCRPTHTCGHRLSNAVMTRPKQQQRAPSKDTRHISMRNKSYRTYSLLYVHEASQTTSEGQIIKRKKGVQHNSFLDGATTRVKKTAETTHGSRARTD